MSRHEFIRQRGVFSKLGIIELSGCLFAAVLVFIFAIPAGAQFQGKDIAVRNTAHWGTSQGHLRVVGLSVTYIDAKKPEESFNLSCDNFAAQAKENQGFELYGDLGLKRYFSLQVSDKATWSAMYKKKIPGIKEVILADCADAQFEAAWEARAAQARQTEEQRRARDASLAGFRDGIRSAWHAAGEAEPFASIRGEFDLSSPTAAWKTTFTLPFADRCVLLKTPGTATGSAVQWTFFCIFRPAGSSSRVTTYDWVVHAVKAALSLDYQPDESAVNVNRVYFSDPSKPDWRLEVTKLNDSSVEFRIARRQSSAIAPAPRPLDSTGSPIKTNPRPAPRDKIPTLQDA